MIFEKSELIEKLDLDKNEITSKYTNLLNSFDNITKENDNLKNYISNLESKIQTDHKKFKELYSQNINDIKCLLF